MKKYFLAMAVLAFAVATSTASANMIKDVSKMNITCTAKGHPTLEIESDDESATITIDGYDHHLVRPLAAATDGGAPFIMEVDLNEYDITIEGKALNTAFFQNTLVNGTLEARVWLFDHFGDEGYTAKCKGLISFE